MAGCTRQGGAKINAVSRDDRGCSALVANLMKESATKGERESVGAPRQSISKAARMDKGFSSDHTQRP